MMPGRGYRDSPRFFVAKNRLRIIDPTTLRTIDATTLRVQSILQPPDPQGIGWQKLK